MCYYTKKSVGKREGTQTSEGRFVCVCCEKSHGKNCLKKELFVPSLNMIIEEAPVGRMLVVFTERVHVKLTLLAHWLELVNRLE